jgi:hypothetical protein
LVVVVVVVVVSSMNTGHWTLGFVGIWERTAFSGWWWLVIGGMFYSSHFVVV